MKSLCYKQTPYLGFKILQRFESVPNEILSTTVIYRDSRTALPLCMIWCFSRRYANPLNTCIGEKPPQNIQFTDIQSRSPHTRHCTVHATYALLDNTQLVEQHHNHKRNHKEQHTCKNRHNPFVYIAAKFEQQLYFKRKRCWIKSLCGQNLSIQHTSICCPQLQVDTEDSFSSICDYGQYLLTLSAVQSISHHSSVLTVKVFL